MAKDDDHERDDTTPRRPRLRRATLRHGGNVIELGKYRDPTERRRCAREAREVLAAGGKLDHARRRTETDERCSVTEHAGRVAPDRQWRPEEYLMLAMLERAFFDLRGSDHAQRAEWGDWLAAEERSHPFGFGSVCDQLGRSPAEVRGALVGEASEVVLRGQRASGEE